MSALSPGTSAAVMEVVRRLRDPMLDISPISIGFDILWYHDSVRGVDEEHGYAPLSEVRLALGLQDKGSVLAEWASGKSSEDVAAALEAIASKA